MSLTLSGAPQMSLLIPYISFRLYKSSNFLLYTLNSAMLLFSVVVGHSRCSGGGNGTLGTEGSNES